MTSALRHRGPDTGSLLAEITALRAELREQPSIPGVAKRGARLGSADAPRDDGVDSGLWKLLEKMDDGIARVRFHSIFASRPALITIVYQTSVNISTMTVTASTTRTTWPTFTVPLSAWVLALASPPSFTLTSSSACSPSWSCWRTARRACRPPRKGSSSQGGAQGPQEETARPSSSRTNPGRAGRSAPGVVWCSSREGS